MIKAAKLVIIDNDDKYLMMYRSAHPRFGDDPDLPGGTVEDGEEPLEAMVREVEEEAGITVPASDVRELYNGTEYSEHGTDYWLYVVTLDARPDVTMSWEHSSYEWLDRKDFLEKAKNANDTYMQMVAEVVGKLQ